MAASLSAQNLTAAVSGSLQRHGSVEPVDRRLVLSCPTIPAPQPRNQANFRRRRPQYPSRSLPQAPCTGRGHLAGRLGSKRSRRAGVVVRAVGGGGGSFGASDSAGFGRSSNVPSKLAPMEPESGVGEFLMRLLQTHPHLFVAACDQQLQLLGQSDSSPPPTPSSDSDGGAESMPKGDELVLYKRIGEVKAAEKRRAVEDIIYSMVVSKFLEAGVPGLINRVYAASENDGRPVEVGPLRLQELESIYTEEALEMVNHHCRKVLAGVPEDRLNDPNIGVEISKLRVTQVYVASIFYGYFLGRVDRRFQWEKRMRKMMGGASPVLDVSQPVGEDSGGETTPSLAPEYMEAEFDVRSDSGEGTSKPGTSGSDSGRGGKKEGSLTDFVQGFDRETMSLYASAKSAESLRVVERHVTALFGDASNMLTKVEGSNTMVFNDAPVRISLPGLKKLFMEAVAFGVFVDRAEEYIEEASGGLLTPFRT